MRGGNGDGVAGGVDGLFAAGVARIGGRRGDAPAAELVGEKLFLVALVGGTAVADEDAAGRWIRAPARRLEPEMPMSASIFVWPGLRGETSVGPAVEGDGVGVTERVAEPGEIDGRAAGEVLGHVQPGEGFDFVVGRGLRASAAPRARWSRRGAGGLDDRVRAPVQSDGRRRRRFGRSA